MPPEVKRFSDFCTDATPLDGDKVSIDAILNQEIMVIGYRIRSSRFGEKGNGKCLTIQLELAGERKVVFTGSVVLMEQFEKYGDQVPFLAVIRKIDRYYSLT